MVFCDIPSVVGGHLVRGGGGNLVRGAYGGDIEQDQQVIPLMKIHPPNDTRLDTFIFISLRLNISNCFIATVRTADKWFIVVKFLNTFC